jgi:hypothetical protein
VNVERILIVVVTDEKDPSRSTYRRYGVLASGRRVADSHWRAGSTSGTFFGRVDDDPDDLEERRAMREKSIRDMHERFGKRGLESLADALAEAGVSVTADELTGLPLDVAFGEPKDEPIGQPPPVIDWQGIDERMAPRMRKLERRATVIGWALVIVAGAFWPSWRQDRWTRKSWRRLIWGGLAGFILSFAVKEWRRRAAGQPRSPGQLSD